MPIRLPDGRTHGMFCCLGFEANHTLNERDLQMMKAFADLAAFEINRGLEEASVAEEKVARIKKVIEAHQLSMVYQPVWNVHTRRPVGLECLARFSAVPSRSPDVWFAEAAEVGLGATLELAAITTALSAASLLPSEVFLALNASPETIISGEFRRVLDKMSVRRIVLEITEHANVEDYDHLLSVLEPLRQGGLQLAVDDAGAGYCSLQHILHLRPDFIKLDMSLTRHIDLDPARRALTSALVGFARETGSQIIAEGVETASELTTLMALGIERAQGYFLGRPTSLAHALKLCNRKTKQDTRVA